MSSVRTFGDKWHIIDRIPFSQQHQSIEGNIGLDADWYEEHVWIWMKCCRDHRVRGGRTSTINIILNPMWWVYSLLCTYWVVWLEAAVWYLMAVHCRVCSVVITVLDLWSKHHRSWLQDLNTLLQGILVSIYSIDTHNVQWQTANVQW